MFTGDLVETRAFPIFPYFPPGDADVSGLRWIETLAQPRVAGARDGRPRPRRDRRRRPDRRGARGIGTRPSRDASGSLPKGWTTTTSSRRSRSPSAPATPTGTVPSGSPSPAAVSSTSSATARERTRKGRERRDRRPRRKGVRLSGRRDEAGRVGPRQLEPAPGWATGCSPGNSLFDGRELLIRLVAVPELMLVEYHVGRTPDAARAARVGPGRPRARRGPRRVAVRADARDLALRRRLRRRPGNCSGTPSRPRCR